MREEELRNILLVKAIEESDRAGEIIPHADRAAASRESLRAEPADGSAADEVSGPALPLKAQRLLAARARRLLDPLIVRYPFLETMLYVLGGPAWVSGASLFAGVALGAAMSALDGSNRIELHLGALLMLVLWNVFVYALLATRALRRGTRRIRRPLAALYVRWTSGGAQRLLGRSSRFNAPLTSALQRFLSDWSEVAHPRLLMRGIRLFHLCSAAVAVGLIAGLYFRGIWRGYMAGWDSTWPDIVPALIDLIYGPASYLTGLALPDRAHLEAIRWSSGPGEHAAPWIHLMALTAILYIVVPRLSLALLSSIKIWRDRRAQRLPPGITGYYRTVLGAVGLPPGRGIASVIPYCYEPSPQAIEVLKKLLPAALGESVAVDLRSTVQYGDEEAFLARLPDHGGGIADCIAVILNLASTPEDENHGTVIVGVREWQAKSRAATQLLVLIDEGPYAARMTGSPERISERRNAWQKFVSDRGLHCTFVDLRPGGPADGLDPEVVERVRNGLHSRVGAAAW